MSSNIRKAVGESGRDLDVPVPESVMGRKGERDYAALWGVRWTCFPLQLFLFSPLILHFCFVATNSADFQVHRTDDPTPQILHETQSLGTPPIQSPSRHVLRSKQTANSTPRVEEEAKKTQAPEFDEREAYTSDEGIGLGFKIQDKLSSSGSSASSPFPLVAFYSISQTRSLDANPRPGAGNRKTVTRKMRGWYKGTR